MKIRMKFRKQGPVKFIGHLDLMRYFQKVMRRADVDIRYSEGFSPHQIMSFASPLGVGLLSNGEYVDIEVHSTQASTIMIERINQESAEGVEIISYRRLPDSAKNAMSLVAAAGYTVWRKDVEETEGAGKKETEQRDGDSERRPADAEFWNQLQEFCGRDSIPIIKKTKKGEKEMDLKPYLFEIHTVSISTDGGEAKTGVYLKLSAGSSVNIKPELLLAAFYDSMEQTYPEHAFQIQREELYGEEEGRLIPLEDYGEDIE